MKATKTYKLQDLIEQIEWVDKMIKSHKENPSPFMREQYEAEKEELLGQLIDELVASENRSTYSFKLILMAINKYYPQLIVSGKTSVKKTAQWKSEDKHYKELRGLEGVLT